MKGTVTRYELPGIRSLNFVLTGALDGGGTMSLRSDHLGKVMYAWLLRMEHPSGELNPPSSSSRRGPMAVLTLNRPDDRNPLDREMSAALLAAMRAAHGRSDVRRSRSPRRARPSAPAATCGR